MSVFYFIGSLVDFPPVVYSSSNNLSHLSANFLSDFSCHLFGRVANELGKVEAHIVQPNHDVVDCLLGHLPSDQGGRCLRCSAQQLFRVPAFQKYCLFL